MRPLLLACWLALFALHLPASFASPMSPVGGGISGMRLLPALIGVAAVLIVTLRALILLQREMGRRVEIERRLATQLSFQQTMMEVVPYPLIAKDMENRYVAVNRAFEDALCIQREDIIGRTAREVGAWGHEHSQVLHDLTANTLSTGVRQEIEAEFFDRNGRSRYGLFWTGAFYASNGERAGVVGTMIDITDIRDAELRARQTERRLHDVTRSLPAVVFQLRRSNQGAYNLPYIDGDTRQLLGLDVAALADDPMNVLRHVDALDSVRLVREIETSSATLEPVHTEFRSTVKGTTRWIRADLVAHREDDGAVVWSGYWADASVEHARAEELARASDTAEAANRAKDDFLAMMSHEIRTPMNGVLGLVEVFENTPLNPDQSQMLGMIQDSASALLQILDDLLDYSKIEAGRLTIESTPIDLRELVDNTIGLLARRAHEKGLRVRVHVAPDVAAIVRGDSVRLRQVLFNLLSNAIKFTIKGEVALHVGVVEQRGGAQVIEWCVKDTGIGIAPEAQASLFESFVQAETSTTRRFGGTGLGLTICNRLVELMGGALALNSALGVGTAMSLRLVMPVETSQYQIDGLRGKHGIVAIEDDSVAQSVFDLGQALGLDLRRMEPSAQALLDDKTCRCRPRFSERYAQGHSAARVARHSRHRETEAHRISHSRGRYSRQRESAVVARSRRGLRGGADRHAADRDDRRARPGTELGSAGPGNRAAKRPAGAGRGRSSGESGTDPASVVVAGLCLRCRARRRRSARGVEEHGIRLSDHRLPYAEHDGL
ncbi:hybrid sensor histidine kinase/response regulator [Candidatus Burkholderia verschuerenii]|uniref:hybrid sensor histidine kinase/response regulator n=1 Tax=Candidatus Burkholderia verschuerenii TaxID=242163 RepID=UPI000A695A0C|nr:ATP-binding protein [Candidatus Burkholderia verschuerenii]